VSRSVSSLCTDQAPGWLATERRAGPADRCAGRPADRVIVSRRAFTGQRRGSDLWRPQPPDVRL